MKTKFLFLTVAVCYWSFAARAQNITFGPSLGINFAVQRLTGNASEKDKEELNELLEYCAGTQFGYVVHVAMNKTYSLQPELLIVQKGNKVKVPLSERSDAEIKTKFTYLEFPVLAKASVGKGPLKGFATAGPTFGYMMSGKLVSEGEQQKIDVDQKLNRFEFSASLGVGANYSMGPGALNLELRYGHGFTGVLEDSKEGNLKNRGFGINLCYLY